MTSLFLKIASRQLYKQRFYTIINVLGLTIGLTAFMFLTEYIRYERSYDKHFYNFKNIYRLTTDQVKDGEIQVRDAMSFYGSGAALKNELPEIIDYSSTYKFDRLVFRNPSGKFLQEKAVLAVDQYFLKLFNYQILFGDTSKMNEPNQIILTRSKALQYFNKENIVNESIFIIGQFERVFNVAAVIEDIPANTHYHFDVLLSISSIQKRLDKEEWSNYSYYTYLSIQDGVNISEKKPLLASLSKKYLGVKSNLQFNLQALNEIHLNSEFTFEPGVSGNNESLKILFMIAWLILIASWVNYTNISTAISFNRAKEVGLRKVMGAKRNQLIFQFLMESLAVNLIACFLTLLLIDSMASTYNNIIGKEILADIWINSKLILKLLLFAIAGALFSGFYPAIAISGFEPLKAIYGRLRFSKTNLLLRKRLLIFQFSISIILIAITLVIHRQVDYIINVNKGMNLDEVIGLNLPPQPVNEWKDAIKRLEPLGEWVEKQNGPSSMAIISNLPGGGSSDINVSGGLQLIGETDYNESSFYSLGIDENVIPLLRIPVIFGRNFKKASAFDNNKVIVNEAFFDRLDLIPGSDMIGKKIVFGRNSSNPQYEIIGIIRDIHRTTAKNEIEPTIYFFDWGYGGGHGFGQLMIKLNKDNVEKSLRKLQEQWQAFFPNEVFSYEFLDDRFSRLYNEDKRFGKLTSIFSLLTLCITILSLIGLTTYMARQRAKEIGIRKVLGASVRSIVNLFYKEIFILIIYACIPVIPLVIWGTNQWLDQFYQKTDFPWLTFLVAMVLLLILSFLAIYNQTHKVAKANPAKVLTR